jgi:aminomethyltransferase
VAKRLVGIAFTPDADVPTPESVLRVDERDAGVITSAVWSPSLHRPIALGYLKRDAATTGTHVVTATGTDGEVVPLPFVPVR